MANVKKKNVNFVYDKKKNKVVVSKNGQNKKNTPKKQVLVENGVQKKNTQKEKNKQKYYARQKKYQQNNVHKKVIVNPEIERTIELKKKNTLKENKVVGKEIENNLEFDKTEIIPQKKLKKNINELASKEVKKDKSFRLFKKKDNKEEINNSVEEEKKKSKSKIIGLFQKPKKKVINPEVDEKEEEKEKKIIVNPDLEEKQIVVENQEEVKTLVEETKEEVKKKHFSLFKKNKKQIVNQEIEKHQEEMPLGDDKVNNHKRVKVYLKEAILYAIIITIINVLAIWVFDYVNYLKLFDLKWVNVVTTTILSLIISYVFSFFIDCLISEIWIKIKSKHKEGEQDGNSWFKRRKDRRNIEN